MHQYIIALKDISEEELKLMFSNNVVCLEVTLKEKLVTQTFIPEHKNNKLCHSAKTMRQISQKNT